MAKVTPEGAVKAEVKRILNSYGAYYFMPVQNGMGAPALDFHCHIYGRAFLIETKAPGKKPTPRQEQTIARAEGGNARGVCFVIDGPAGYDELVKWLNGAVADERERNPQDQADRSSEDDSGELVFEG